MRYLKYHGKPKGSRKLQLNQFEIIETRVKLFLIATLT